MDAGRLVARIGQREEVRTKDDFRPNGGAIVPKIEYKRLIQNQREREEARIREDSMNRMRENMSFRGGRGHGGNDNHRSLNPQSRNRPGFPGFVPGITGGAYDLYPNPDPTGGFNPLPPPGSIPDLGGPLQRRGQEEAISSPTREETFPGSKASPAACRGAYRPQTVAKRPIDSHTRTASTRRERQRAIWRIWRRVRRVRLKRCVREASLVNRKENRAKGRRKREGERERKKHARHKRG